MLQTSLFGLSGHKDTSPLSLHRLLYIQPPCFDWEKRRANRWPPRWSVRVASYSRSARGNPQTNTSAVQATPHNAASFPAYCGQGLSMKEPSVSEIKLDQDSRPNQWGPAATLSAQHLPIL